jgi:AraC-like DNA-binding protein
VPPEPEEKLRFLRIADIPGVELFEARSSATCWKVFHDRYVVTTGPLNPAWSNWVYRRRQQTLIPGTLGIMEPGESHYNPRISGALDFDVLFIEPELMASALGLEGVQNLPHWVTTQPSTPALYRRTLAVHHAFKTSAPSLETEYRLFRLLNLLVKQCSEAGRKESNQRQASQGIRRAVEFIHAQLSQAVSLQQLAQIAGISKFHFLRQFKAATGLPPHEYQTQLRISRARRSILKGTPLALVAADLGFVDQSHFGRHFRRIVGLAPAQYQRM